MISVNMLAGPIAGAATCFVFYPLDTIKTRLQSPAYRKTLAIDKVKRVWYRGLYQGIGPVVMATLPASAAFFTTYYGSKRFLNNNAPSIPAPIINCAASSLAEIFGSAVVTPAEVIKQNAQVLRGNGRSSSSLRALQLIGRDPRNLWRGYSLLVCRNLPFIALQFPVYEELKMLLGVDAADDWWEMSKITAISAGVSGGLAAWVTTPIDVVKTRIMLSVTFKGERVGVGQVFKKILKEDGPKELFRGGLMRVIWAAMGSGMYLAIYEGMVTCFGRPEDR